MIDRFDCNLRMKRRNEIDDIYNVKSQLTGTLLNKVSWQSCTFPNVPFPIVLTTLYLPKINEEFLRQVPVAIERVVKGVEEEEMPAGCCSKMGFVIVKGARVALWPELIDLEWPELPLLDFVCPECF